MLAIDVIKNMQNIIKLSPLRTANGSQAPVVYSKDELHGIESDLELLKAKCETVLKVVVLGEVKAGKSTLLNALAGGMVAPTDVTETTASIMTITYGEKAAASIHFVDNTSEAGTPEEVFAILDKHQNDQEYFKKCDHVEVQLHLDPLKKINIVDTPGLATITSANSQRTEKFFQQADVVLWVFNAHYLGQSDINAELEQVANMGKPIIGVINRIDEIEGEKEKLVRYLKRELGIYLQNVFPLSAKQAYTAVVNKDDQGLNDSGFSNLVNYLEHNIERQADKVQNESLISSANVVLGRELILHKKALADLDSKFLIVKRSHEKLKKQSDFIRHNQEGMIRNWFDQEFLTEKERAVQAQIRNISIFKVGSADALLKTSIENTFSGPAIKSEIDTFLIKLDEHIRNDWKERLNVVQNEVSDEYNDLLNNYHVQEQRILNQIPDIGQSTIDSASQGVVTGGVFGGAISAYAAWLGPAAAHISIGSALGAFMPPFLLAGVATGAVMGAVKYRKMRSSFGLVVAQTVDGIRKDVAAKVLPNILGIIKNTCDNVVENCHGILLKENFNGRSEEELQVLKVELEQHVKIVESSLKL